MLDGAVEIRIVLNKYWHEHLNVIYRKKHLILMCNIRFECRIVFVKKFRQSVSDAAPRRATQSNEII